MSKSRHISQHVIKGTVLLMTLVMFMLGTLSAGAQEPDKRHVTPVVPQTNQVKPPPKGTDEEVIQHYINGDSAEAAAQLRKDSLRRIYKHYPLFTDLTIGLNIAEPLFMALGQSYASTDVSATLNMWNRLQPTVELGVGWANNSPVNYNFLFKSAPDYQAIVGIRLGYSTFGYDVNDAHYMNSYWREDIGYSITGERSHALWGEAGVGLKVKLWDRLSMGWMIRYHGIMNYGKNKNSKPWFIPGYGPRSSSLGLSLGIYYRLR